MKNTRLTALLTAAITAAAVGAATAPAAGATVRVVPTGPCAAIHPGYMGSQKAANGMFLGVSTSAQSPVVATPRNDFNTPFGARTINTCFDETHTDPNGANVLYLAWRDGTRFSPANQFITATGSTVTLSSQGTGFIFNDDTQQQVAGGKALSLNLNGTVTLVPAAATLAQAPSSTRLTFDPAS